MTVGVAFALACIALTAVIALLTRVGDWTRSLSWWVSAAVCLTAGYALNVSQALFSSGWMIAISNPLTIMGACLFLIGMRHAVDRPIEPLHVVPIIAASILGSVVFVFIWPNMQGRVFCQLTCLMLVTWLNVSALRLLDHGYYHFPARYLLGVNLFLMLFIVVRGVIVILLDAPATSVTPTPVNTMVYGISGLLIAAYLAGILLICFAEKQTLLRKLAAEDNLTGVHNRLGLRDALALWPQGQRGVVTLFDIDQFKRVNDGHGHEAGDILLKTFAQALRATAPQGAIIARLGGDEFCVVESVSHRAFSNEWIITLKNNLPIRLEIATSSTVSCKVSHGSARFASIDKEFTDALRAADRALYRSKARKLLRAKEARAASLQ